jgi:hypothetical protein
VLLGAKVLTSLFCAAAVNAQTGEEVAVKLVLDSVFPLMFFMRVRALGVSN